MAWVVVAILLFVIIVFGYTSGAQSYATAQQAQAQIEVAKVAQVNAWGNLVTILIVGLIVLLILAVIAVIAWLMMRRSINAAQASAHAPRISTNQAPAVDSGQLNLLIQALILERLSPPTSVQLPAPEEDSAEDSFPWLTLK